MNYEKRLEQMGQKCKALLAKAKNGIEKENRTINALEKLVPLCEDIHNLYENHLEKKIELSQETIDFLNKEAPELLDFAQQEIKFHEEIEKKNR